jgi:hypothetical protein
LIGKPTIVRIARGLAVRFAYSQMAHPVGSEHLPHVAAATDGLVLVNTQE